MKEWIRHMRLRIDTTEVQFFCTRAPEQRTVHETGAPRIDKETAWCFGKFSSWHLTGTGAKCSP